MITHLNVADNNRAETAFFNKQWKDVVYQAE